MLERLDKIIANQLNISRRDARLGIRKGQASVNNEIQKDPSVILDANQSEIVFGGKKLEYKKNVYFIMNKPKGVLSASSDKSRTTVVNLVPDELQRNGLFPVGRLDKDTTGLLIITDDGDFAHSVISPKKHVMKTYIATLDGTVTEEMVSAFKEGIVLADGTKCRGAVLKPLPNNKAEITIYEGKYHIIKRMFGTFDLGVNELHRKSIGLLELPDDLKEGNCRELSQKEINLIFSENVKL